jgi:hypothetical protein
MACITAHAGIRMGAYSGPGAELLASIMFVVAVLAFGACGQSPYAKPLWRPIWSKTVVVDEREFGVIAAATARSYAVLLLLLTLAFIYLLGTEFLGMLWTPDAADLRAILLALVFAFAVLPIAIAEWSVPPPPPVDEEEI